MQERRRALRVVARFRGWTAAIALLLIASAPVYAQTVTIAWDPNNEPDLAGYIIGYGTAPGRNDHLVNVGLATQWTLGGLASGRTYYFRVYAYDTTGLRSAPSSEVSAAIATSGASSCPGIAPAPGWICQSGNWLPPDSPLLRASTSQPTAAPTSTNDCPGTAPVAGWICLNGNWLPPDSPLLASIARAPTPTGTTGTTPAACPGIAPGVGWVCLSGNWLPPDSPLLFGITVPTQPSAPAPSACLGVAPAAGWVCVSGGNWVPPDHPLAKGG